MDGVEQTVVDITGFSKVLEEMGTRFGRTSLSAKMAEAAVMDWAVKKIAGAKRPGKKQRRILRSLYRRAGWER